ncbi:unnamed protein product [Diatraea saccharalis]|uniref:C2H2-type domain-containing protein n=1 Tax=Diatraea saccharalis TaxID=40085 RepID=A0A9N9WD83_9NEOP|nr:unnamed protein product [Diatraea saccharalis]
MDEFNNVEQEIKIEYEDTDAGDPLFIRKCDRLEINEQIDTENIVTNAESENNKVTIQNANWYKHIDGLGKYHCKFCDIAYSSIKSLRAHTCIKHPTEALNIKAAICNIKRSKKLLCYICKKAFNILKDLEHHMNDMHPSFKEGKYCHICHSVFEYKYVLSDHMLSVHNIQLSKMLLCSTCGYVTIKLSHYKQHLNTHFGQNTEKCKYCDYKTNYLPNLSTHEKIHSENKLYLCNFTACSYRAKSSAALRSHKLKHFNGNKFLYCDKCIYRTVYKQTLQTHMKTHKEILSKVT